MTTQFLKFVDNISEADGVSYTDPTRKGKIWFKIMTPDIKAIEVFKQELKELEDWVSEASAIDGFLSTYQGDDLLQKLGEILIEHYENRILPKQGKKKKKKKKKQSPYVEFPRDTNHANVYRVYVNGKLTELWYRTIEPVTEGHALRESSCVVYKNDKVIYSANGSNCEWKAKNFIISIIPNEHN